MSNTSRLDIAEQILDAGDETSKCEVKLTLTLAELRRVKNALRERK